jgi:hypothetical protein
MKRRAKFVKLFPTRRTVKRWGIGAVIVLGVLLVLNGVMSWRTETRFRRLVAAIRQEGDPASIAELKPEPIPDDDNAAAQIDRLTPRLNQFSKEHGRFYKTDVGKSLDNLQPGERPNAEQIAAMRSILDKYSDLEQMVVQAADSPSYASTADFSLGFRDYLEAELPRMSRIRDLARFINWRVQVLTADGQRDEAVERALDMLRLSKLSEAEPSIVSFLITVAVRNIALHDVYYVLTAGPVTADTHQRIDQLLQSLEDPNTLQKTLRTERALSVSASIEQGWEMAPAAIGWLTWPVKRHFIAPIEYYERLLPLADRPWYEVKPQFSSGGALSAPTGMGVLADLLAPAIKNAFEAASRSTAAIRSLRVFNALQQFATKNGREASGLEELELSAEATTDPFTGRPLIVRRTDGEWSVYSVGENGVDDGGAFERAKDCGFGPTPVTESAKD